MNNKDDSYVVFGLIVARFGFAAVWATDDGWTRDGKRLPFFSKRMKIKAGHVIAGRIMLEWSW